MRRLAAALSAACIVVTAMAQEGPKLKVGNPAPPLKVAGWVKGTPVKKFDKGKVYVVEFWATWCGPCKVSIPHLTEMAKQFKGKVTFVGVSVWESSPDDYDSKVPQFVKDMGDKMDYNVAIDDAEGQKGTMAQSWMMAAGQNGIPCAFIIGKKGTIEWIGHPMGGLDKVLEQVVADKFDATGAADEREKKDAEQAKMQAMFKPVSEAANKGDWKGAAAELDKIIDAHPEMEQQLAMTKVNFLQRGDEDAMYKYMTKLGSGPMKDNAMALNEMAWMIVDDKSTLKTKNLDVAMDLATKAVAASKEQDGAILDTLAAVYFKKGNVDKAIEYQEKAVALVDKGGPNVTDEMKQDVKNRLEEYKKKKSG
jgi:thiol-disulfide isomerase/thioredoxin